MGTFPQTIDIAAAPTGPYETIEALVDTGATFMLIPRPVLERLRARPLKKQPFMLANGSTMEYDISALWVRIGGEERPTICVWGDAGATPLLGSFTLEAFLLGIDPINKRLVPVTGFLV